MYIYIYVCVGVLQASAVLEDTAMQVQTKVAVAVGAVAFLVAATNLQPLVVTLEPLLVAGLILAGMGVFAQFHERVN